VPKPKKPQDVLRILKDYDKRFVFDSKKGKGSERMIFRSQISMAGLNAIRLHSTGQDVGKGMLKAIIRRFQPAGRHLWVARLVHQGCSATPDATAESLVSQHELVGRSRAGNFSHISDSRVEFFRFDSAGDTSHRKLKMSCAGMNPETGRRRSVAHDPL